MLYSSSAVPPIPFWQLFIPGNIYELYQVVLPLAEGRKPYFLLVPGWWKAWKAACMGP